MHESIDQGFARPTLDRITERLAAIPAPHAFRLLDAGSAEAFTSTPGLALLFLAEDPLRVPESWDVAVILADALRRIGTPLAIGLVGPDAGRAQAVRYGARIWPALVGLRDGEYLGCIEGMLDWAVFERRLHELLASTPAPRPGIGIPVVAAASCH